MVVKSMQNELLLFFSCDCTAPLVKQTSLSLPFGQSVTFCPGDIGFCMVTLVTGITRICVIHAILWLGIIVGLIHFAGQET